MPPNASKGQSETDSMALTTSAAHDGAPQGDLVSKFEIAAMRDTARDPTDSKSSTIQLMREKERRGLAFHRWRGCDDELLRGLIQDELA